MNKLVIRWILYSKSIIYIPFIYVLIVCVSYDTRYNLHIQDTYIIYPIYITKAKKKIYHFN